MEACPPRGRPRGGPGTLAGLGLAGCSSSGSGSSSSWRFTNHLANMPLWFEFQDDNVTNPDTIKGAYLSNYKDIFDLYTTDSTVEKSQLSAKTSDDAVAEFVGGEAVFYQTGSWDYKNIKALGDDKLGLLPIYIGVGDDAKTAFVDNWATEKASNN
jgi:raffinose/stachyose/melibiose transport system substrate-binding protein